MDNYCNISIPLKNTCISSTDILYTINDLFGFVAEAYYGQYHNYIRGFKGFDFCIEGDNIEVIKIDVPEFSISNLTKLSEKSVGLDLIYISVFTLHMNEARLKRASYISPNSRYENDNIMTTNIEWVIGIENVYTNCLKVLEPIHGTPTIRCAFVFTTKEEQKQFESDNCEYFY